MYGRLTVVAALSLVAALPLDAQLCAGTASFTNGRMQVGGQIVSNDDYSSYGVGLTMGNARGLYGGPQIANNNYDVLEESGLWIGATGGYQLRPHRSGFQICPVARFGLGLGPDNIGGSDVDMSVREFAAGAIIGKVVYREPSLQLIPTGGISIVNRSVELSSGGASADDSETFFSLDFGAGILLSQAFTIRPMISIPMGADGQEESYSLGISYNFGRRAATGAQPARRPARRSR
jgi:hypothetical protein